MSSALSVDLRQRVVHAVEAGASRHQAAERFGVSLASASRWCGQFAREGHVAPKPLGGDRRSHRIESHAHLILALYEAQPGIFLLLAHGRRPGTQFLCPGGTQLPRRLDSSQAGIRSTACRSSSKLNLSFSSPITTTAPSWCTPTRSQPPISPLTAYPSLCRNCLTGA